jgi:hypothetical protein
MSRLYDDISKEIQNMYRIKTNRIQEQALEFKPLGLSDPGYLKDRQRD